MTDQQQQPSNPKDPATMTTTTEQPRATRGGRRGLAALDRIELYWEAGTQPGARLYRWRMRSGANGQKLGSGHESFSQRDRCLANARHVTGYDLPHDPRFTEPQPGIDGLVSVWLVDPKSRRGYPG